jgi:hypothetical protein
MSNQRTVTKPPVAVDGIWLLRLGDRVIVRAEVEGRWIDIIEEHIDGSFSHIVEPAGIRSRAAMTSAKCEGEW